MSKIGSLTVAALLCHGLLQASTDGADGLFGENGKVIEMLSENGKAVFSSLSLLPSGKILAGGNAYTMEDYSVMTLYRYLENGKRDPRWNHGEPVTIDYVDQQNNFPNGGDVLNSVLLQSPKQILVGATLMKQREGKPPRGYIGIARYTQSGEKDPQFGTKQGWAFRRMGKFRSEVIKTLVAPDKKIYTLGVYSTPDSNETRCVTMVCKFDADGKADRAYGTRGCTEYYDRSMPTRCETPKDFLLQPDGKIVIVGEGFEQGCDGNPSAFHERGFAVRLEANGTLDRSFANDGVLKMTASSVFDPENNCSGSSFASVALQKDGKIVVLGNGQRRDYDFFLTRITQDGKIDKKFGFDGVVAMFADKNYWEWKGEETRFREIASGASYIGRKVLIDENGKIIVAGVSSHGKYGEPEYRKNFFAARYTAKGRRDWTYGTGGVSMAHLQYPGDYNPYGEYSYELADALTAKLQKDGKVLIGGSVSGSEIEQHAWLVRLKKYFRVKSYDGAMGSDLLWKKKNGSHEIWYMNRNGRVHSKKNISADTLKYLATGDFNGDGVSDIIWQIKNHPRRYRIWYFKEGENAKKSVKTFNVKRKTLIATGDFNGDGTDDIIFKNGQKYSIWFMQSDGKFSEYNLSDTEGEIYAVGDFDGDHVCDLLTKRKDGLYLICIMRSDGKILFKIPMIGWDGYRVGGIGDFDGDGSDDMLLKDDENRWFVWTFTRKYHNPIGTYDGFEPVSVGDYNGDGFADIIWKEEKGKAYKIWLMSPWPDGDIKVRKERSIPSGGLRLLN